MALVGRSPVRVTATPSTAPQEAMAASLQAHIDELVQKNRTCEHTIRRLQQSLADEKERGAEAISRFRAASQQEGEEWREGCDSLLASHRIVHLRTRIELDKERMNVLLEREDNRREQISVLHRDYKLTLFQAKETDLEAKVATLEDALDELKEEYEQDTEEYEERITALEIELQRANKIRKEVLSRLKTKEAECTSLQSEVSTLRIENTTLKASTGSSSVQLERATLQLEGAKSTLAELESTNAELKRTNADMKRQLDRWQTLETKGGAEVEEMRKRRIELEVEVKELQRRVKELEKSEKDSAKVLEKERNKIEKLKRENDRMAEVTEEAQAIAKKAQDEYDEAAQQLRTTQRLIEKLQSDKLSKDHVRKGKRPAGEVEEPLAGLETPSVDPSEREVEKVLTPAPKSRVRPRPAFRGKGVGKEDDTTGGQDEEEVNPPAKRRTRPQPSGKKQEADEMENTKEQDDEGASKIENAGKRQARPKGGATNVKRISNNDPPVESEQDEEQDGGVEETSSPSKDKGKGKAIIPPSDSEDEPRSKTKSKPGKKKATESDEDDAPKKDIEGKKKSKDTSNKGVGSRTSSQSKPSKLSSSQGPRIKVVDNAEETATQPRKKKKRLFPPSQAETFPWDNLPKGEGFGGLNIPTQLSPVKETDVVPARSVFGKYFFAQYWSLEKMLDGIWNGSVTLELELETVRTYTFLRIRLFFLQSKRTTDSLSTTIIIIDAFMNIHDNDCDIDSLFGSRPSSPVPEFDRGGSPPLALPGSPSATCASLPKNVGTIALPGSHNSSELVVSLPASPPRPQAPQFVQSGRHYRFAEWIGPKAPSIPAFNARQAKPRKKKPTAKRTTKKGGLNGSALMLPNNSEPLPPNFLRNQQALLGLAGMVGGINPARLSPQGSRGATPQNPIVVDDAPSISALSWKSLQQQSPVSMSQPGSQAIADTLVSQGNIFPVLCSLAPYFGLNSNVGCYSGQRMQQYRMDQPGPSQHVPAPPLKRRKLNSVPAGADDWDVPYPFPADEGPPDYLRSWEKKRTKKLMMQLVSLVRDAVQKATAKISGQEGPSIEKVAEVQANNDAPQYASSPTTNLEEVTGFSGSSPTLHLSTMPSLEQQTMFSDLFATDMYNCGPSSSFSSEFDSFLAAVNTTLSDPNVELTGNDLAAMSSFGLSPTSSTSPSEPPSTRLSTPSDFAWPSTSENKENASFPQLSDFNFSDIPIDPELLDFSWSSFSTAELQLPSDATPAHVTREGGTDANPEVLALDVLSPGSVSNGSTSDTGKEPATGSPSTFSSIEGETASTSCAPRLSSQSAGCPPTYTALQGQSSTKAAEVRILPPTFDELVVRGRGGSGRSVKKPNREEVLRRARIRREQIAAEIARAKIELWETTIEQGVLTHLTKSCRNDDRAMMTG